MKIIRAYCLFFCVVICAMGVCACKNINSDEAANKKTSHNVQEYESASLKYNIPSKQEVVLTSLKNCDVLWYANIHRCEELFFSIVTSEPLSDDATIVFDTDIEYEVGWQDLTGEDGEFGYDQFLAYNGEIYNHSEYSNSEVRPISETEYKKCKEYVPTLYRYDCEVVFYLMDETTGYVRNDYTDVVINTMTVNSNGRQYKFDIGNIEFDFNEKRTLNEIDALEVRMMGISNLCIDYNPDGEFVLDGMNGEWAYACKDLIINDIQIPNANTYEIQEIKLILENENNSIQYVWEDGKQLHIKKGTSIKVEIAAKSDIITKDIGYCINPLLVCNYNVNGIEETAYLEMDYWMYKYNRYDIYAFLVDGIDIFSYYMKPSFTEN